MIIYDLQHNNKYLKKINIEQSIWNTLNNLYSEYSIQNFWETIETVFYNYFEYFKSSAQNTIPSFKSGNIYV